MPPSDDPSPARWGDSPWLWFFLFAAVALVALAVIGPKHVRRQQRLVRMQQARERVSAAQAAGQPRAVDAAQAEEQDADEQRAEEWAQPVVSVLPLTAFLVLLLAVVGTGLLVTARRRASRSAEAEKPPP